MTLTEVIFYFAIVAVITTPLVSSILVGTDTMVESDAVTRAQERNRATLFSVGRQIRKSMDGSLVVSGKSLESTLAAGFDGADVIPGSKIRYELEADPGDPTNGVDDNKNGLTDEGRLVWTDKGSGESVAICASVDLGSSGFVATDTGVTITLCTAGRSKRDGVFRVTRSLTVYPRN